jgi:hypothetical protein
MIKDFVPAKTNLKSGIIIKQHLLNRSKHDAPRAYIDSSSYTGFIPNSIRAIGGTGGTFDEFNTLTNAFNTQSWYEQIPTLLGYTSSYHSDQAEFYNGELPYYPTIAINGEANPNNITKLSTQAQFIYNVQIHFGTSASFLDAGFMGNGQINVWYDEGSDFNGPNILLGPGATPTFGGTNSPVPRPNISLPPLADTTDRDGSSGGGSGGGLGTGGGGRTNKTASK